MPRCTQTGFSLIELVFVIVLASILAIIALPRFSSLNRDAHRASVTGTAASFQGAIIMASMARRVNGYLGPGANDNVNNFGANNVDVNTSYFPTDTANSNVIGGNATRCVNIWNGILQLAPTIATGATADYQATAAGEVCTYIYRVDTSVTPLRRFTYSATTGLVTVTVNPVTP